MLNAMWAILACTNIEESNLVSELCIVDKDNDNDDRGSEFCSKEFNEFC
jgi:hypothetical protein